MMSDTLVPTEEQSLAAPLMEGHLLQEPVLCLRRRFYCMGFAVDLETNHPEVQRAAEESWGRVQPLFQSEPIQVKVTVLQSASSPCPPAPLFRSMGGVAVQVADAANFMLNDMEKGVSQVCVSEAAVAHRSYFRYFFLEAAALSLISTRYCVPIHAACVSRKGQGVLLCGPSGAGKSSLAYACARAGWTYTTDDASYMLLEGTRPAILGNHHQLRFRPSARDLFPELKNFEVTPRAAGKPSIELPTSCFPALKLAPVAQVDLMVFLDRVPRGGASIAPSTAAHARAFLREPEWGPAWLRERREKAAAVLLGHVPVVTMTYATFDDAIHLLEKYLDGAR